MSNKFTKVQYKSWLMTKQDFLILMNAFKIGYIETTKINIIAFH